VVEEREAAEEEQAQTTTSGARSPSGAVDEPPEFLVRALRDSWSRSARRKRRGDESGSSQEPSSTDGDDMKTVSDFFDSAALVCVVRLAGLERQVRARRESKENRLELEFQWVYGRLPHFQRPQLQHTITAPQRLAKLVNLVMFVL
jgi:hypothetical protein